MSVAFGRCWCRGGRRLLESPLGAFRPFGIHTEARCAPRRCPTTTGSTWAFKRVQPVKGPALCPRMADRRFALVAVLVAGGASLPTVQRKSSASRPRTTPRRANAPARLAGPRVGPLAGHAAPIATAKGVRRSVRGSRGDGRRRGRWPSVRGSIRFKTSVDVR